MSLSRRSVVRAFAAVSVCGSLMPMASAQSGRYYVTDESGFNQIWQFQGGLLVNQFPTVPAGGADGPIIVDGNTNTIRSVKGGFGGGSAPSPGSEYNFAGAPLGPVSLDFSAHAGFGRVIDAGFDGQNAYIVSGLFGAAGVFRYNADFSGPGAFVFAPNANAQGITVHPVTGNVWTSDYDLSGGIGFVREWDPNTGLQLSSFPVTNLAGVNSERNTALAYDPTDNSFWMNAHVESTLGFGFGELWQFDAATGNFLQAIHAQQSDPTAPANILYWGGEIFIVPAPGAAALAGLAGLIALRRRRD
jgi:uncharacterized protein (TIGR03382 family)